MAVAFYMDVHVPQAVTDQLRRQGVDVLTAFDDKSTTVSDPALLERAGVLQRVIVTFDIRFKAMAEDWQRTNRAFHGLIYAHIHYAPQSASSCKIWN